MLNILYEDSAIIVCIKEAGIATQTKNIGQKDMESMLRTYRVQKGEASYIGIVHRLDQPVSGIMVFAKTKEAAADLGRQMAGKAADKYYYAITEGNFDKKSGKMQDYLLRDGRNNLSKVVSSGTAGAKQAELSYKVLKENDYNSLVQIKLHTGRHHQIRVQMAHAGYPLKGDRKYNFNENMKRGSGMLFLCSYKLVFLHPITKKKLQFEIENPFSI